MSSASAQTIQERNKALVARWFEEVWNQGRRETIGELLAAQGVIHDCGKAYRGPGEFTGFHDELRAQFSGFSIQPVVSLAEGDLVCVHWLADFVHTASGKPMRLTGTSVARVSDGQIAEAWQNWDAAGLTAQLA
jgi:predicted SnoaL-like aldol condensation-catalyzing enzyme